MGFVDSFRLSTMFTPSRSKTLNQTWSPAGPSKPSPWEQVDFTPQDEPEPEPEPQRNYVDNYMGRMREIQEEDAPALRRYRTHLAQTPEEGDYRPGVFGRIASALGGMSAGMQSGAGQGIATAVGMNRMNYENAVNDWGLKGKGLKEEADLEIESQRDRMKNLQAAMGHDLELRKFEDTSNRGWYDATTRRTTAEGNLRERGRANDIAGRRTDIYGRQVDNQAKYQEGQLGLGRQRNNTYQQSVDNNLELGQKRNSIARDRVNNAGQKPFKVIDQQRAADMAMEELAKDSVYGQLVEEIGKDSLGRPVYAQKKGGNALVNGLFLAELEARKRKILNFGGRGSQNPESPDDEDMELYDDEEDDWDIQ